MKLVLALVASLFAFTVNAAEPTKPATPVVVEKAPATEVVVKKDQKKEVKKDEKKEVKAADKPATK